MLVSPKPRQRDLLMVKAATSERVTFYVGASSILSTLVPTVCISNLKSSIFD